MKIQNNAESIERATGAIIEILDRAAAREQIRDAKKLAEHEVRAAAIKPTGIVRKAATIEQILGTAAIR